LISNKEILHILWNQKCQYYVNKQLQTYPYAELGESI